MCIRDRYISDASQAAVLCPDLGNSAAQNAEKVTTTDGEKEYELTYLPYTTEESVSMALAGTKIMPRFSGEGLPPCGTYLTISVIGVMRENVIVIPVNALHQDSSGSYVYCVREAVSYTHLYRICRKLPSRKSCFLRLNAIG